MARVAGVFSATPGRPKTITFAPAPPAGSIILLAAAFDNVLGSVVSIAWDAGTPGFTDIPGTPLGMTADGGVLAAALKLAGASETGIYTIDGSTATYNLVAAGEYYSGRDAAAFLHRSSVGVQNTAQASPWPMPTAAFSSVTTDECDVIYIAASDNAPGGTVTQAPPGGYTMGEDVSDGTFFNFFIAYKAAVAAGETGVLSGTGTKPVGVPTMTAGWAAIAIALKTATGGGGLPGFPPNRTLLVTDQTLLASSRRRHRPTTGVTTRRPTAMFTPGPAIRPRVQSFTVGRVARTTSGKRHRSRPMESGLLIASRLSAPAPPLPPARRCIVSAVRASTSRRHHPTTTVTTRRPTAMFVPGPAVKPRVTQFLVGDPLRASQRRHRRQRHETEFGLGARPTATYTPVLVYLPEIDLRPKRVRRFQ